MNDDDILVPDEALPEEDDEDLDLDLSEEKKKKDLIDDDTVSLEDEVDEELDEMDDYDDKNEL